MDPMNNLCMPSRNADRNKSGNEKEKLHYVNICCFPASRKSQMVQGEGKKTPAELVVELPRSRAVRRDGPCQYTSGRALLTSPRHMTLLKEAVKGHMRLWALP